MASSIFLTPGTLTVNGLIVTGVVTASDGSASAPSYAFTAEPSTGFYRDTSVSTSALSGSVQGARTLFLQFHPTVGTSVNGQGNTFVGYKAGLLNYTSVTNAYNNTFIGGQAGVANDSGYQDTFLGSNTGSNNTTGFANTFLGQGAGYSNTTAANSTYVGWHAGLNVISDGTTGNTLIGSAVGQAAASSTANANTMVGVSIGTAMTDAVENAIVGYQAANALTSGDQNAILGAGAGNVLTTGSDNVFVGRRAGYTTVGANATTTGAQSIYIGTEAGSSVSSQISNAIAIGYRATVGASNAIVIGNASHTVATIYGAITVPGYSSGARSTSGALQSVTAAVTLSGASTATSNIIPAGATVEGIATTTTTTITGASGYQVGDGSDADRYGDITGTAVGTASGSTSYTADPRWWTNAARAVTLTAKTSNFTGGVVQVTVFYRTAAGA